MKNTYNTLILVGLTFGFSAFRFETAENEIKTTDVQKHEGYLPGKNTSPDLEFGEKSDIGLRIGLGNETNSAKGRLATFILD